MASNINGSCVAWDCRILDDKCIQTQREKDQKIYSWINWDKYNKQSTIKYDDIDNKEINVIDNMGNIEHLRNLLPKDRKYELKGGKMYWLTDRTPHEVMVMKQDGWRQFFRLVSNKLS
eukprot:801402_1